MWPSAQSPSSMCQSLRRFQTIFLILLVLTLLLSYLLTLAVKNLQRHVMAETAHPTAYPSLQWLRLSDRQEAERMQEYLRQRPKLMKAAICMLVQRRRVEMLKGALHQLHANFNHRFGYPILLLHEPDFLPLRSELARQPGPVFFQEVSLQPPTSIMERFGDKDPTRYCPWSGVIGYRHMCRFYAIEFHRQPVFNGLDYYWRLDDDSLITKPFIVDPFRQLRDANAEYGFIQTVMDSPLCTHNLWSSTIQFMALNGIKSPTFFHRIPRDFMFYNNFEISSIRFWRSPEYQKFSNFIDDLGGTYQYRWGDAPIKTLGLSLFARPDQIIRFTDVGYSHGSPTVPPRVQLPFLQSRTVSVLMNGTI